MEVAHVPGRPAAALLRQSAGCLKVSDYEEGDVRVTTAFNRMLGLPGAWVRDVEFGAQAMIVTVALRRKQPVCSGCGRAGCRSRIIASSAGGISMRAVFGA